jgi:S1-C subfamily serine protease
VRDAQALLYRLGYNPGPIDGILGERTRSAIKEFQRDFGLPVTGKMDKNLLLDLRIGVIVLTPPEEPPVQITRPKPEMIDRIPGTNEILTKMPSLVAQRPLNATELYKKVQSSVFVVIAGRTVKDLRRGTQLSQGSAVAVSRSHLLTNCHILGNWPYILVVQDEKVTPAALVGRNEKWDRCVLAIKESRLDPIKGIRGFDDLIVGEKVYTVGAPIGLERTLGEGIISGLRKLEAHKLIQTSAQISSGSSGGGLFDARGNLLGITTFLLRGAQNLNFAIAAEQYWDKVP